MKRFRGNHLETIDKAFQDTRVTRRRSAWKKYYHSYSKSKLSAWKYLKKLVEKYSGKSEAFIYSKFLEYYKSLSRRENHYSPLEEFQDSIANHPSNRFYNRAHMRWINEGDVVIDNQKRLKIHRKRKEKKRYYIYEDDYTFDIKVIGRLAIPIKDSTTIEHYKNMWSTSFGGLSFKDTHLYKDIYGSRNYSTYLWNRIDNKEQLEKYYKLDDLTVIIGRKIRSRKEISKKEFMRRFYEQRIKERAEEKKREKEKINTVYNFSLAEPVDWEGKLVRGKKGETVIVYHHLPYKKLRRWHKT